MMWMTSCLSQLLLVEALLVAMAACMSLSAHRAFVHESLRYACTLSEAQASDPDKLETLSVVQAL